MDVIVLAGGGGTRLWPLSVGDFPKQFLKIYGNRSLLQNTVLRILKLSPKNILILTNEKQKSLVERDLGEIDVLKNVKVVTEPEMKNTAPAIALGIRYLIDICNSKEKVVFITPSDSYITPEEDLVEVLKRCEEFLKEDYLLTFGVVVTRVETGYGYIEIGDKIRDSFFKVNKFTEKPDYERALKYKNSGKHYWNSGMFMFNVNTFQSELKKCAPEIYDSYRKGFSYFYENFSQVERISVDYALMEKSGKVAVCPLSITWSDVGNWDAIFEIESGDEEGNILKGSRIYTVDVEDSLVWNRENEKIVALLGVRDVIVVNTPNGILITKKGLGQKVREIVEKIKEEGRE